jgi:hypothetical protein
MGLLLFLPLVSRNLFIGKWSPLTRPLSVCYTLPPAAPHPPSRHPYTSALSSPDPQYEAYRTSHLLLRIVVPPTLALAAS